MIRLEEIIAFTVELIRILLIYKLTKNNVVFYGESMKMHFNHEQLLSTMNIVKVYTSYNIQSR
jgi:hypothetical protein